jgi:hypothetical protein
MKRTPARVGRRRDPCFRSDWDVRRPHRTRARGRDADLVTDTVEELTGRKPMSVDQRLARNLAAFR